MKEIRWIEEGICQYIFVESEDKPGIDVNITVLINGGKALLIDTGFSNHSLEVKKDLAAKGIEVDEIILSHYHPDHAAGATEFPVAGLSCSKQYRENYRCCRDVWDKGHDYREPDRLIADGDCREYGDFSLAFIEAPGHSRCSLITVINDRILHVGDLIMSDELDRPIIPYICGDGGFTEHINSLKVIKELGKDRLLLSHGREIKGRKRVEEAVDKRVYYLNSVVESAGKVDVEAAFSEGVNRLSYLKWHKDNLINSGLLKQEEPL